MDSKKKLFKTIVEEGAMSVEDLGLERSHWYEDGEEWRVRLKRAASFIWGGVERTLPAGAELGEVYIDFTDGETAEDVAHLFLAQPETWGHSVEALEREMLDAE